MPRQLVDQTTGASLRYFVNVVQNYPLLINRGKKHLKKVHKFWKELLEMAFSYFHEGSVVNFDVRTFLRRLI